MPESLFFISKGLWYRCFPVNFVKFLRTPTSIEHLLWLLLFGRLSDYFLPMLFSLLNVDMHWLLITLSRHSSSWLSYLANFLGNFFVLLFFSLNLYKSKENQTDICEKKQSQTKIITRQIYTENLPWRKLKKLNLPEKPDCILKKCGSFVGKYFRHYISLYRLNVSQKSFFLVLNWIDDVFCFFCL